MNETIERTVSVKMASDGMFEARAFGRLVATGYSENEARNLAAQRLDSSNRAPMLTPTEQDRDAAIAAIRGGGKSKP